MSSVFPWLIVIVLLGIVIYLVKVLIQIRHERDRLKQDLRQYDSLSSREETEKQLDSNIQLKQDELQNLNIQQQDLQNAIINLKSKLRELEDKEYLISIDEYEPKYNFLGSEDYQARLKQIRLKQQKMKKNKQAFVCDIPITVQGSTKADQALVNDILKIVEVVFDKECKYITKNMTKSICKLEQNISKSFDQINKILKNINCRISEDYLMLKLIELDIEYELKEKKQEENERAKAIRDQMKQEEKERREIEKAQREAEEAEQREKEFKEALERKIEKIKLADLSEKERETYEHEIKQLKEKLAQAETDKEKANSYVTKLKSGYIYVISNIGSLGENIYRIFMTQSSNPDKYITTMNPYVPFPFDIHYKIFSEDASATKELLHQYFNDRRVNIENERREFFKVSFSEIEQAIQEIYEKTGILNIEISERVPQAYEYRRTRRKANNTAFNQEEIDQQLG